MNVFHVFWIVYIVPNCATHHIWQESKWKLTAHICTIRKSYGFTNEVWRQNYLEISYMSYIILSTTFCCFYFCLDSFIWAANAGPMGDIMFICFIFLFIDFTFFSVAFFFFLCYDVTAIVLFMVLSIMILLLLLLLMLLFIDWF